MTNGRPVLRRSFFLPKYQIRCLQRSDGLTCHSRGIMTMNQTLLIIGPGRLGTSLFRAMRQHGIAGPLLIGKKDAPAPPEMSKRDARFYRQGLQQADVDRAGFVFVAVPDDKTGSVAAQLASFGLSGKAVVHTSGALSAEVLRRLLSNRAFCGSFHPMQSFNRRWLNADVWKNIVCSYEGDEQGKAFLATLCQKLGAKLLVVNEKQKLALHLAAVVAANYQTGLLAWAEKILQREGLEGELLKNMIAPLSMQVQNNYEAGPLKDVLSGPVLRGDLQTIEKHLKYLKEKNSSSEIRLYKEMARFLAEQEIFDVQRRQEILKLLERE